MAKKRDYIGKHALYEKAKELASSEFFPNSRAMKYSAFNGLDQYRVVEDVYSAFHNTGSFTYHSSHEYFRI